jgi:transposase
VHRELDREADLHQRRSEPVDPLGELYGRSCFHRGLARLQVRSAIAIAGGAGYRASNRAPADRAAVREFLGRFAGEGLEVALEATTGWRFVVEELERVGAEVHLAESTETSGLRGRKKRAKTDWADARHLRELLLIGRLPESWIPPAHLLDLRARVRCRHLISHQRGEWQQRIQAVAYHHGIPQHRNLMSVEKRQWLAEQQLPAAARKQIDVALAMIDALDIQLAPLDKELRDYARRQPGCKALIAAHHGIGPLCAVTILAELGDARRFQSSRDAVR